MKFPYAGNNMFSMDFIICSLNSSYANHIAWMLHISSKCSLKEWSLSFINSAATLGPDHDVQLQNVQNLIPWDSLIESRFCWNFVVFSWSQWLSKIQINCRRFALCSIKPGLWKGNTGNYRIYSFYSRTGNENQPLRVQLEWLSTIVTERKRRRKRNVHTLPPTPHYTFSSL